MDLLFRTASGIFSYRVAGVLVQDGKVLLQHPLNQTDYAFPGGHAQFGETSAQTVVREFKEETGLEVVPLRLLWVAEIFFPWGRQDCHQICLYYQVAMKDGSEVPCQHSFLGCEDLEGNQFDLEFSWVGIQRLDQIELYPPQAGRLLQNGSEGIEHFVYVETGA